jgi:integrase
MGIANSIEYNHSEYEELKVGNSLFEEDIWDLSPLIEVLGRAHCTNIIRFGTIKSDSIKNVIKRYLYYKIGQVKPQTVITCRNSLTYFLNYCEIYDVTSLQQISKQSLLEFNMWLKDTRHLSKRTGYLAMFAVEELIRIGSIKNWDVPPASILTGMTAAEIWGSGPDINSRKRFEPIPDDVFQKIVSCAMTYDYSLLAKAGILIQSQTGLRIGEVLSIQSGCLHMVSGHAPYFEVFISKTSKEAPILHKVYANELVVHAIEELEEGTKALREETGKKELFLRKNHTIGIPSTEFWSSTYLRTFIRKSDIRGKDGELYHLRSHQFRSTFVKHLVLKGVPIAFAMKQFAHVSVEMTSHYLMLQEKEIKDVYSRILLGPDNKLVGINAEQINHAKKMYFNGCAREDYESYIENLSEGLTFNPLPGGICLYDYRRGNCSEGEGCLFYNCPNFITERSFLPILEEEMDLLSRAMYREQEKGHEREWQRMNSKFQYLKPIVDELNRSKDE